MKHDEFAGQGGSFEIRDGKRVRVQAPTKSSDTGGARDPQGNPLPGTVPPVDQPAAEPPAPAPTARHQRKPD